MALSFQEENSVPGLGKRMPAASIGDYGLTLSPTAADLLGDPTFIMVGFSATEDLLRSQTSRA